MVLLFLLTGCSGRSSLAPGSSIAPQPQSGAAQLAQTLFTFVATNRTTSAQHKPQYIGAGTQSVSVALVSVNGSTVSGASNIVHTNVVLTNCPCAVPGPSVPVGSDVFLISTYDGQYTSGVQNGALISTASTGAVNIVGGANTIDLTLNGVPQTLGISALPAGTAGTAFGAPAPFSVVAKDVDGNTIVGTYTTPVTLTDNDTSGATAIATAGGDNPPAGQLLSSTDTATLNYTGRGIAPITISASATGASSGSAVFAPAGVVIVSLTSDATPGAIPGQCPGGTSGDLRSAICSASAGNWIIFTCGNPCTITLAAPLPPIDENLTIDGGTFGNVIIDGASAYRAFFIDTGTVALANLQIQNATAQGGSGGSSATSVAGGGGGGAGLGAGVFVNQASAALTVTNDYFLNCTALGGAGGFGGISFAAAGFGGGGLGFAGGASGTGGGDGGGGVLGAGTSGTFPAAGTGGTGGGGGGGALGFAGNVGAAGGSTYALNAASGAGENAIGNAAGTGGSGGFGGGGGGGGYPSNDLGGNGGSGGFGGGGGGGGFGGGSATTTGGAGVFGGGGGSGAGLGGSGGAGGALATVSGGSGSNSVSPYGGGGGAAAGPAIFVNAGSVTTANSGASGDSATPGAGGGGGATAGTANGTPVFNLAGTVNGSATTGPVASALSGSMPTSLHRRL